MQKVKSMRNGKSIQNGKKYARNVHKDANMYANVSNCVRKNFSRYENAGIRNVLKRNVTKLPGWLA